MIIKKTKYYAVAGVNAYGVYDDLQANCKVECQIGEIKRLNWCYFRSVVL